MLFLLIFRLALFTAPGTSVLILVATALFLALCLFLIYLYPSWMTVLKKSTGLSFPSAGNFALPVLLMFIPVSNRVNAPCLEVYQENLCADEPNKPVGTPVGIKPGRVIWAWNPDATNENCVSTFEKQDWYWKPENTNVEVVGKMFRDAIMKLTEESSVSESWDKLFRSFNERKTGQNSGYRKGEKIFIKINQSQSRWLLSQEDKEKGYYVPRELKPREQKKKMNMIPVETGPAIVLELLKELVNDLGIEQSDISVGDPIAHIYGHNYDVWARDFPDVVYADGTSTMHGRTLIRTTENDRVFFSNTGLPDKTYDIVEEADYIINIANLRTHGAAIISLTAKNHFGSITTPTSKLLHFTHLLKGEERSTYKGYNQYRALVDLMGSAYLGQNTMLNIVEALFGGGADETKMPVKYFMPPFNNDWCNSIFLSEDQVAIESVCYDFLRAEWNGINKHSPLNNEWEIIPDRDGIDDYLHQAADHSNWPEDIIYDPDKSGKPLSSLGVHEHWKDPVCKQYSRNLGKPTGIELISIPDSLVVCNMSEGNKKMNRHKSRKEKRSGRKYSTFD